MPPILFRHALALHQWLREFLHDRLFTDGKQAEVPVCDEEIVGSIITNMLPVPGCKFLAGRTEITQKQWDAVCKDITYFVFPGESNPAHNVSWNDCRKFIYILNQQKIVREAGLHFRLPSEWEWEYVAAAGGKGSFGKTADAPEGNPVEMGWISDNAERHPHPVALKTPNAWGFHDMHGNVWEWTTTSFDAGNLYVLKGGSWQGGSVPSSIKYRISYHPPYRGQTLGLRLFADKLE